MSELALSISEPADVMLLPEMWMGAGSTADDSRLALDTLAGLCDGRGGFAVSGGLPWNDTGRQTMRTWIIDDAGNSFAFYDKVHLSSGDGESKNYAPGRYARLWNAGEVLCAAVSGYDVMFPEFCRQISAAGAQILFVSARWREEFSAAWEFTLRAAAFVNQCYIAACNLTGESDGEIFCGNSIVVSPDGEIAGRMGTGEGALKVEFDLSEVARCKRNIPLEADRRGDIYVTLR
jgi:predicted amidohydrolase